MQCVAKSTGIGVVQQAVALHKVGFGVVLPQGLKCAGPVVAQLAFQRCNERLIRRIQRLDVVRANIGVEGDPIRLVAGTVGDFENAAGADGFVNGFAQRATVLGDGLQHHRGVADRHKACALEQVHQGQRATGLAYRDRAAGGFGRNGRHQRHLIAHLEDLLDLQRREAPETLGPLLIGIEALPEVAEDRFDVPCFEVHGRQDHKANGGIQEVAPRTGASIGKYIGGPLRCVIRRGTLQRFSAGISRVYLAAGWDISVDGVGQALTSL
ncbi:hypothetical protein PS834_03138 [Pseudomonas fluorescens]|nr:hypothetical protein PS834_03138 [Pseudomonas fluorescens]